jgi:hypothetical protein
MKNVALKIVLKSHYSAIFSTPCGCIQTQTADPILIKHHQKKAETQIFRQNGHSEAVPRIAI